MTAKNSSIKFCKDMLRLLHFTSVLIENVVVLANFDTFWLITFYVSIGSKNFVNESCLSHRDEAFDIGVDRILCLWMIFEFSSTKLTTV